MIEHLPDLRGARPGATTSGWMALAARDVVVPELESVRRCRGPAPIPSPPGTLEAELDLDDAVLVGLGPDGLVVRASMSCVVQSHETIELSVARGGAIVRTVTGRAQSGCELVFEGVLIASDPHGTYELSLIGAAAPTITVELADGAPPTFERDPCAITLAPTTRSVAVEGRGSLSARPPLLAVDRRGCVHAAWAIDAIGRALVPDGMDAVELRRHARGGLIARLAPGAAVRDAAFFAGGVVVLAASAIHLYDLGGCAIASPWVADIGDGVALAADGDRLVVVRRGSGNVRVFRRDGSELAAPATFDGRGWYAALRSRAFVVDERACSYRVDPSRAAEGCCADAARELSDEESAFFAAVADLPSLRRRTAWAQEGTVVLGPSIHDDALDSHRPGTRWHRVIVFGEIPKGCAVEIETRSGDDVRAGDPRSGDGWSRAVTLGSSSRGPVAAPGDERIAAGDALVLAERGRFLWIRLTLLGNGAATPRIESIEVVRPREGIARYLPRVYRDSTPEDDFLRRWLAIFETTVFDGVAMRMDAYGELFDPRTAPERMLPYLARWLELPTPPIVLDDPARLRRILIAAPEIARSRGTARGLALIVRLYLDFGVRIREVLARPAVLGVGRALGGASGPALGGDTMLAVGPRPTDLGEAILGCTDLVECDERIAGLPSRFDVLVSARDVCTSERLGLLRMLIDLEKPAHTAYRVVQLGTAGFVVGAGSIVGQDVAAGFDGDASDGDAYGIVLGNGPPRSAPIGRGLVLGFGSRLAPRSGQPVFRVVAAVGRTTRVGE